MGIANSASLICSFCLSVQKEVAVCFLGEFMRNNLVRNLCVCHPGNDRVNIMSETALANLDLTWIKTAAP